MPADTIALFDRTIIARAAGDSFAKLNPLALMRNPVIFVTEVVAALVTLIGIEALINHTPAFFPDRHRLLALAHRALRHLR